MIALFTIRLTRLCHVVNSMTQIPLQCAAPKVIPVNPITFADMIRQPTEDQASMLLVLLIHIGERAVLKDVVSYCQFPCNSEGRY